jgi:hypothetical protein
VDSLDGSKLMRILRHLIADGIRRGDGKEDAARESRF